MLPLFIPHIVDTYTWHLPSLYANKEQGRQVYRLNMRKGGLWKIAKTNWGGGQPPHRSPLWIHHWPSTHGAEHVLWHFDIWIVAMMTVLMEKNQRHSEMNIEQTYILHFLRMTAYNRYGIQTHHGESKTTEQEHNSFIGFPKHWTAVIRMWYGL